MKKIPAFLIFVSAVMFYLNGCGMDDSSSSGVPAEEVQLSLVEHEKNEDLRQVAPSLETQNQVSGITVTCEDSNGTVLPYCLEGDTAVFRLGDTVLGASKVTTGKKVYTLTDILGVPKSKVLDFGVLNAAQLLISLDKDKNIQNGIDVTGVTLNADKNISKMSQSDISAIVSKQASVFYDRKSVANFLESSLYVRDMKFISIPESDNTDNVVSNDHTNLASFSNSQAVTEPYVPPIVNIIGMLGGLLDGFYGGGGDSTDIDMINISQSLSNIVHVDLSEEANVTKLLGNTVLNELDAAFGINETTNLLSDIKNTLSIAGMAAKAARFGIDTANGYFSSRSKKALRNIIAKALGKEPADLTAEDVSKYVTDLVKDGDFTSNQASTLVQASLSDKADTSIDQVADKLYKDSDLRKAFTDALPDSVAEDGSEVEKSMSAAMDTDKAILGVTEESKSFAVAGEIFEAVGAVTEFLGPIIDMYFMSSLIEDLDQAFKKALQEEQSEISDLQKDIDEISCALSSLSQKGNYDAAADNLKNKKATILDLYGVNDVDSSDSYLHLRKVLSEQSAGSGPTEQNASSAFSNILNQLSEANTTSSSALPQNTIGSMNSLGSMLENAFKSSNPGAINAAKNFVTNGYTPLFTNPVATTYYNYLVDYDAANEGLTQSILYYYADYLLTEANGITSSQCSSKSASASVVNSTAETVLSSTLQKFASIIDVQAKSIFLAQKYNIVLPYMKKYVPAEVAASTLELPCDTNGSDWNVSDCAAKNIIYYDNCKLLGKESCDDGGLQGYRSYFETEFDKLSEILHYESLKLLDKVDNADKLDLVYDEYPLASNVSADQYFYSTVNMMDAMYRNGSGIYIDLIFPSGMLTYQSDGNFNFSDEGNVSLDMIIQASKTSDFSDPVTEHVEVNSTAIIDATPHVVWLSDNEITQDSRWNFFKYRYPLDANSTFGANPGKDKGLQYFRFGINKNRFAVLNNIADASKNVVSVDGQDYYVTTEPMQYMELNATSAGLVSATGSIDVISGNSGWYWGLPMLLSSGGNWTNHTLENQYFSFASSLALSLEKDGWSPVVFNNGAVSDFYTRNGTENNSPSYSYDNGFAIEYLPSYKAETDSGDINGYSYISNYQPIVYIAEKNGFGSSGDGNISLNVLAGFDTNITTNYTGLAPAGMTMYDIYRLSVNLLDKEDFNEINTDSYDEFILKNNNIICQQKGFKGVLGGKKDQVGDFWFSNLSQADQQLESTFFGLGDNNCSLYTFLISDGEKNTYDYDVSIQQHTSGSSSNVNTSLIYSDGQSFSLYYDLDYYPVSRVTGIPIIETSGETNSNLNLKLNYLYLGVQE